MSGEDYYATIAGIVSIKENLEAVYERIEKAAGSVGRNLRDITLIAAIKSVPLDLVFEALEAGVKNVGENRVQEAAARHREIKSRFPEVSLHMIGHLQRNKVRQALDIFDIIQSVDSGRLARELSKVPILIEVNTSGEAAKYGVSPDAAVELLRTLSGLGNIKIKGLMTLAPLTGDPRPSFFRLRKLSEEIMKLGLPNIEMSCLSMGMTDDFEAAIQEGSNMVRIGRAIFGERS